jgi:histone H3/H4
MPRAKSVPRQLRHDDTNKHLYTKMGDDDNDDDDDDDDDNNDNDGDDDHDRHDNIDNEAKEQFEDDENDDNDNITHSRTQSLQPLIKSEDVVGDIEPIIHSSIDSSVKAEVGEESKEEASEFKESEKPDVNLMLLDEKEDKLSVSINELKQRQQLEKIAAHSRKGYPLRRPFCPRKRRSLIVSTGKVLLDIKKYQKSTGLLASRSLFKRTCIEVLNRLQLRDRQRFGHIHYLFQAKAIDALHEASEQYLTILFQDTNLAALHRKRITITDKDLQLVLHLRAQDINRSVG